MIPPDQAQDTARILIADDESTLRALLREALQDSGYEVDEACDGNEAVARFAARRPDLVLMDVRMPDRDGFEACAAMRLLPGGDAVPILIMTGLDDVDSIRNAYEAGATDFASKPVNLIVLRHRIRYMLRAKRTLDDLRQSESRLSRAQHIARIGSWERDLRSGELRWSAEMYQLFGVEAGSFRPTHAAFLERVHPADRDLVVRATEESLRGAQPYSSDLRVLLPDGTVRFVHEQAELVRGEGGAPARLIGTTQDTTERKQAEDKIRFLAYYDGLSRLPNRLLFTEKLGLALEGARRQGQTLAVLFLDIDRFKRINDTLGHTLGDRLLQGVAERLKKCLRSSDTVARGDPAAAGETVARLGGDEFIVSLTEIARGEDAARVARRILDSLQEPFRLDEHEVAITGSIGISVFPNDGGDVETLLKNADTAMYHAKDAGRNCFQFYSTAMNAAAVERLTLENSLRKALERGEFLLHFQPLVDLDAGTIMGAEALIRWRHPQLGLVPPMDFIPLAEETGLILPIGEWVLRNASAQCKAWQEGGHGDLIMSVNLSGRQFRQQQLVHTVDEALKAARLDPRHLELEITESILMRSVEETLDALNQLKSMGLRISVDDFGTGYSSLNYLTRYPIDTLKIDQSFIREISRDQGKAAITAAIISMARGLRLAVIAEGVETQEQLVFLRQRGCRLMQGYLFGRPVPVDQFERLLVEQANGTWAFGTKAAGTGS